MWGDELRILRDRHNSLQEDIDRLPDGFDGGSRGFCCVTVAITTYPTSANAYYGVQTLSIDGDETEGSSPTFTTDDTSTFTAYNLGSQIPPVGTEVLVFSLGGRFVFRYDG